MSKYVVMSSWEDAPHLDDEAKAGLLKSYPPHERDARTKGIPQLGSGAIYPVPESEFTVAPFAIPAYWPKGYSVDVGWNRTAALLGALDREADCLYLIAEYYGSRAEPAVHAAGIRAWGQWLTGVIDPAARGRGQADGEQLLRMYTDLGLTLFPAENAVESGLWEVLQRLTTGRLKVFSTLQNFFAEFRKYRRDLKGHVVKQDDHLMDAKRYMVMSGLSSFAVDPNYLTALGHKPHIVSDWNPHAIPVDS